MKLKIIENRVGMEQNLNGYVIYCLNNGIERSSWWSAPGSCFGGVEYLQDRGYSNITTFKEYKVFAQIARVLLAKIRGKSKYYRIILKPNNYTGYRKKYVTCLNSTKNKLSFDFKDAKCFTVEQMAMAIESEMINYNRYFIEELEPQNYQYYFKED